MQAKKRKTGPYENEMKQLQWQRQVLAEEREDLEARKWLRREQARIGHIGVPAKR